MKMCDLSSNGRIFLIKQARQFFRTMLFYGIHTLPLPVSTLRRPLSRLSLFPLFVILLLMITLITLMRALLLFPFSLLLRISARRSVLSARGAFPLLLLTLVIVAATFSAVTAGLRFASGFVVVLLRGAAVVFRRLHALLHGWGTPRGWCLSTEIWHCKYTEGMGMGKIGEIQNGMN